MNSSETTTHKAEKQQISPLRFADVAKSAHYTEFEKTQILAEMLRSVRVDFAALYRQADYKTRAEILRDCIEAHLDLYEKFFAVLQPQAGTEAAK